VAVDDMRSRRVRTLSTKKGCRIPGAGRMFEVGGARARDGAPAGASTGVSAKGTLVNPRAGIPRL
jgi:hypothetical protein